MTNFCRKPDYSKGSSYSGKSTSGTTPTDQWITITFLNGANSNTAKFYLSNDGSNWVLLAASLHHNERGNTAGCAMFYVPKGWSYKLESNYNQKITFWECV